MKELLYSRWLNWTVREGSFNTVVFFKSNPDMDIQIVFTISISAYTSTWLMFLGNEADRCIRRKFPLTRLLMYNSSLKSLQIEYNVLYFISRNSTFLTVCGSNSQSCSQLPRLKILYVISIHLISFIYHDAQTILKVPSIFRCDFRALIFVACQISTHVPPSKISRP